MKNTDLYDIVNSSNENSVSAVAESTNYKEYSSVSEYLTERQKELPIPRESENDIIKIFGWDR